MNGSLFIFNPDNDLALANGDANFVASRQVKKMTFDLELLPVWYAEEYSSVLVSSAGMGSYIQEQPLKVLPGIRVLDKEQITGENITGVNPWGWNPMLIKYLHACGISETILPTELQINRIRRYAHRSFSVELLTGLVDSGFLCGSAKCLYSVEEVKAFVEKTPGSLLKAPWSGSGKGLFWAEGEFTYLMDRWVRNVLEKQQCVIAETVYDKIEDFAIEFYSDGNGSVHFAGYSLFQTDKRGAYKRNLLDTDERIHNRISGYVSANVLSSVRDRLEKYLSASVGIFYKGYLGVDMMVCRFDEKPNCRIHPCVEINLRMSMGMVSRLIYDRFVLPGERGYFSVDYFKSNDDLQQDHREAETRYPLVVRDGKMISGYLALTPVSETTHYCASIRVG